MPYFASVTIEVQPVVSAMSTYCARIGAAGLTFVSHSAPFGSISKGLSARKCHLQYPAAGSVRFRSKSPRSRNCKISAVLPHFSSIPANVVSSLSHAASISVGLAILGAVILIHECGHYFAARWQSIKVANFSIGFGPKIFSFTLKGVETEFTFRMLPFGGFVAFPEHTQTEEETGAEIVSDDPDLLQNRPLLDRAIVISAGIVANIVLAWAALFASVSTIGLQQYNLSPGVLISAIVDNSGAGAAAGIRSGDVILSVDNEKVPLTLTAAGDVAAKIRSSGGREMSFHLQRDSREIDLKVKPKCCSPTGDAAMGIQLVPNANVVRVRPSSPVDAIVSTNRELLRMSSQTIIGLRSIVTNFRQTSSNLSGPVGVVAMGASLATNQQAALLSFCALISLNLAVINALPFPALDGGQMLFLFIEGIRGSPVSSRIQETVNRTALLMFLAFSGVLLLNDLEKLSFVSSLDQLFG